MSLKTSELVNEISEALAKAQGEIKHAIKDATNPHYKSKYADLAGVISAAKDSLAKHGLSVVQGLSSNLELNSLTCATRILHKSGQWIESELSLRPSKPDPQGYGSAATYARRYSLAAMLGIAQEDDDGNAASQPPPQREEAPKKAKGTIYDGNDVQKRALTDFCISKGLVDIQIKHVHEQMLGKPSSELIKVIEDVRGLPHE